MVNSINQPVLGFERNASFIVTASSVLAVIIVFGIASNYLYGITKLGVLDDLIISGVYIASAVALLTQPAILIRFKAFFIAFAFFCCVDVLFLFNSPISYLYETYKLTIFLSFVPLLIRLPINVLIRLDEKIVKFASMFFAANLLIIGLQYVVTPWIVVYLGLPKDQIMASQTTGRWVGLFEGVNNFGDAAVLMLLANEVFKPKIYKTARLIFGLSVLISTSKHAILIMAIVLVYLYIFQKGSALKKIRIGIGVGLIIAFGFALNMSAFTSKMNQYKYLAENITGITNKDSNKIEVRALHIASGISILLDNPMGVGLGVWGDASSKYKVGRSDIPELEMSDSWMIHILVEQGMYSLIYFSLFFSGFIYAKRLGNSVAFTTLAIFFFLSSLVTMGLSSGSWPILFAYLYARFTTHAIPRLGHRK